MSNKPTPPIPEPNKDTKGITEFFHGWLLSIIENWSGYKSKWKDGEFRIMTRKNGEKGMWFKFKQRFK